MLGEMPEFPGHSNHSRIKRGSMKRAQENTLLTRQELKIMKVVWDNGPSTVKDVCEAMSQEMLLSYTTVMTLMAILERKGVLTHRKSSQAFVYRPLLSRRQATRNHVRDVIARYLNEKPENLLAFVMQNEEVAFIQRKPESRKTLRCGAGNAP